MRTVHRCLRVRTGTGIALLDVTPDIRELVTKSGVESGFVTVTSRHTTTAVTINENEERLLADTSRFLADLASADAHYLHNDIHLRDCPPDEPRNAHAHLLAMLVGSSEVIPIVAG